MGMRLAPLDTANIDVLLCVITHTAEVLIDLVHIHGADIIYVVNPIATTFVL